MISTGRESNATDRFLMRGAFNKKVSGVLDEDR